MDILFLISEKINKNILKKEIERSFVTFNYEISPRIDILNNFKNEGIYQTIIKNNIVIKGASNYIRLKRSFWLLEKRKIGDERRRFKKK